MTTLDSAPDTPADTPPDVVIWGVTRSGRKFRPSDWSERLAGLTAAFKLSDRLAYSPLVSPVELRGVPAVIVAGKLQKIEPRLYQFLLNFARDNELTTISHPEGVGDVSALVPPVIEKAREPREPV